MTPKIELWQRAMRAESRVKELEAERVGDLEFQWNAAIEAAAKECERQVFDEDTIGLDPEKALIAGRIRDLKVASSSPSASEPFSAKEMAEVEREADQIRAELGVTEDRTSEACAQVVKLGHDWPRSEVRCPRPAGHDGQCTNDTLPRVPRLAEDEAYEREYSDPPTDYAPNANEALTEIRARDQEIERLRTVIRTGGAMYRAERACLGIPGGYEPRQETETPIFDAERTVKDPKRMREERDHYREKCQTLLIDFNRELAQSVELRRERDAARKELARLLNVTEDRNATSACSGDWERCWCSTCKERRGRAPTGSEGSGA